MKSILLISPERWDAHTVSKHHYAMTLAEIGYVVFFLNPPDEGVKGILVTNTTCPGLKIVTSPTLATGLRFFPALFRNYIEKRWLNNLEIVTGTRIDAIWLFENSRFFDMRFAGERLKIYHQVDLNQDFNREMAAKTADICFAVSDIIKKSLVDYNKNVFKITHGTNEPETPLPLRNEERKRFELTGKHAVYIGNIDIQCLDAELLTQVVENHPTVNFHLVGGYSKEGRLWKLLEHCKNVIWWGKVRSELIPSILEKADILLAVYKIDQWEYVANPHKFMEYFSSGKVVVATYTDEYKDKRHLLEMTDNSSDYIRSFGKVLANLDKYNSDEQRAIRVDFAKSHTYKKQIEKIFNFIRQSGFVIDIPEAV